MSITEFKSYLENSINSSDEVYVTPHVGPDFDAIASSIGICEIANKLQKPSFVLIGDKTDEIEQGVRRIIDNTKDKIHYLNMETLKEKLDTSLTKTLITVDVNKTYMVCINEMFDYFKPIVLIDHHAEDENTIKADCKLIDTTLSSASEIITKLLSLFGIKIDPFLAVYLYAGIKLDTSNFSKNMSPKTFSILTKLASTIMKDLDLTFVEELFAEDFESDRKVQNLVDKTVFETFRIAIAANNENPNTIYLKEDLAKVADYLLKYNVSAAFALGYIDENTISISARSNGLSHSFNVGRIMSLMNGGGNETSGATKIDANETDLFSVQKTLKKLLKP